MTLMQLKAMIAEYEARRNFAVQMMRDAADQKDVVGEEIWSDIESCFYNLVDKLKDTIKRNF